MQLSEQTAQQLRSALGSAVVEETSFRGATFFRIDRDRLLAACRWAYDAGFTYLVDVFGVDRYTEEEERFEVGYNLVNLDTYERLHLKVYADEGQSVPSVTSIYPGANWPERETFDMYGIPFSGHPDLRRMYMPEGYLYYPLRKDYPLMGIPGAIPIPEPYVEPIDPSRKPAKQEDLR